MRSAQAVGGLKSFDSFWSNLLGGGSESGESVNHKTALTISAVYNAVQVIAEGIAGAPIEIYQRLDGNGRQVVHSRPEYYLVHNSPNEIQTAFDFWMCMMVSKLLTGNAYAYIERDGNGFPVAFHFYQSNEVGVWLDNRRLWYKFPDKREMQPAADVLHLKGMSLNGYTGISPIAYHANTLGNAIAATKMQGRYYRNGTPAKGWIETPEAVTTDQAKTIAAKLKENYGGDNAYTWMVLPRALKFHGITLSQADAQYIEDKKMGVEDVARIFNIQLHMIKSMGAATRANMEQQAIEFVTITLRPHAKSHEQEMDRKLFGRQSNYFTKHNLDALKRGDMQARAMYYSIMRYIGALNADEIRGLEGYNPREDEFAKDYLTPTNMYAEDQLKALIEKLQKEADATNEQNT